MRLSGLYRKMTKNGVQGGGRGETTPSAEIINDSAVWFLNKIPSRRNLSFIPLSGI